MKGVIIVVFLFIGYVYTAEDPFCSICLPNGVNCISEREYKICRGQNSPEDGKVHTCTETQVCTDEAAVCLEKVQPDGTEIDGKCAKSTEPSDPVGKLGDCEFCADKFAYACIGPSTYALCMGAIGKGKFNPDVYEDCPRNYICNAATTKNYNDAILYNPYYPCIPSCSVNAEPSCENDYVPTEKPEVFDPMETCKSALKKSLNQPTFESLSTDCSAYVYCEQTTDASGVTTINPYEFECKEGKYFDNTAQKCLDIPEGGAPIGCNATAA